MKKVSLLLIVLCSMFIGILQAWGEDVQSFAIQQVTVNEMGQIRTTVFDPRMENLQPADYKATLDDKVLPIETVSSMENEKLGTTWIFVVDRSVMNIGTRSSAMKALLKKFVLENGTKAVMGQYDSAAIVPTGTPLNEIKLTSNKTELDEQIEALKADRTNNALYQQAGVAIKFLSESEEVKGRSALVLLSTGQNEIETGLTYNELMKQMETSDVTCYSFAFHRGKDGGDRDRTDKSIISRYNAFARTSKGGLSQELRSGSDGVKDVDTVINAVAMNELRFRVLMMDAARAKVNGERLNITQASNEKIGDSTTLVASQREMITTAITNAEKAAVTPSPAPTLTPAVTFTPTPAHSPTPEPTIVDRIKSLPRTHMVLIGVAALAVIILIIAIIKKSRGRKKATPSVSTEVIDNPETEPIQEEKQNTIIVKLESVGLDEQKSYTSPMVDEIIIGRSPEYSRLIVNDPKVGRRHCKLSCLDGVMCLEDLNSTNGTKVNGMRVTGKVVLHQQDTINIGLTNLRISWQKSR